MNNAARVIDTSFDAPGHNFSDLANMALWGVCLTFKRKVVATHYELAILRRCAKLVNSKPGQLVHVISPSQTPHTDYIVTTLMHFGVSCGQIDVRTTRGTENDPQGIWLLVGKQS